MCQRYGLSVSLNVSTVKGLELMIASIWMNVSSFKLQPRVWSSDDRMELADLIWRCYIPPMWLAAGVLCFHWIQSAPLVNRNSGILSWSISFNAACSSFLAPTKFEPLSHLINLIFPLLPINLLQVSYSTFHVNSSTQ